MRGLTAVDCSPRPREGCMAGGLHQLWRFDPYSESFRSGWGNGSSPQDFVDGASFRYRVREIRFVPGSVTPAVQAIAVTSGCCTIDPTTGQPDPTKDTPRVLLYDGDRWHSTIMGVSSGGCDAEADPNAADSYYALTVTKALYYAGGSQIDYSLLSAPGGSPQALSTPGGVPVPSGPSAPEATSQINTNTVPTNFPPPSNGNASQCFCPKSSNPNSLTGCDITLSYGWATADATAVLRPPLGRVRLVAGDGDHGNFRFMSPRAEMRRVGGAVRSVDGP
jgi:hypothetical protein